MTDNESIDEAFEAFLCVSQR